MDKCPQANSLRFALYFEKKRVLLKGATPIWQGLTSIKDSGVKGNLGKGSWVTKGAKFNWSIREVFKMIELLRKTLLMGIGAATLTKEKIDGLVDELVKKGEIASKEGPELVKEFLEESQKAKKELEKRVDEATQKALKKLNLASGTEMKELKARVKELEKRMGDESGSGGIS